MLLENFETYEGFMTRAELEELIKISGLHTMINNSVKDADVVFVGKINQRTFPDINVKISQTLEKAKAVQSKIVNESTIEILSGTEYEAIYEDLYYHLDLATEEESIVELFVDEISEGANWWSSIFKSFKSKLEDVAKTKLSKKVEVVKQDSNKFVVKFLGKDLFGIEFGDKVTAYVPDGAGYINSKNSPKKYQFNRNLDQDTLINMVIKAYKAHNKDLSILEAKTPKGLSLTQKALDILTKLLEDDKISEDQLFNIVAASDSIQNSLGEKQSIDILIDDEKNYILIFPVESKVVANAVAKDLQLLPSDWDIEDGDSPKMKIKTDNFKIVENSMFYYYTSLIKLYSNMPIKESKESLIANEMDILYRWIKTFVGEDFLTQHDADSPLKLLGAFKSGKITEDDVDKAQIKNKAKYKADKKFSEGSLWKKVKKEIEKLKESYDPQETGYLEVSDKEMKKAKVLDKELRASLIKKWKGFEKASKDYDEFYVVGWTQDPEVYETVIGQVVFKDKKVGWFIWTELNGGEFLTEPVEIEDEKQLKQLLRNGLDFGLTNLKENLSIPDNFLKKLIAKVEEINPDAAKEITHLAQDKKEVNYMEVSKLLSEYDLDLKKIFKTVENLNEAKESDRVKILNDAIRKRKDGDLEAKRAATQLNSKFAEEHDIYFDPHPSQQIIRIKGLYKRLLEFYEKYKDTELLKGWELIEYFKGEDEKEEYFLLKIDNSLERIYHEVRDAFSEANMLDDFNNSSMKNIAEFSKLLRKNKLDVELIEKAYEKAGIKFKFKDSEKLKKAKESNKSS